MSDIKSGKKNVRDDEMDLLDLFRRIGKTLSKWTRALLKGLLISIVFLFRNWLPLLVSIFIGIGVSYILKSTQYFFLYIRSCFQKQSGSD